MQGCLMQRNHKQGCLGKVVFNKVVLNKVVLKGCLKQGCLTPRLSSSLANVFDGMNCDETKTSPSLFSVSGFESRTFRSTTSKLRPPAVLPFGMASNPSSRNVSKILASSALFFW